MNAVRIHQRVCRKSDYLDLLAVVSRLLRARTLNAKVFRAVLQAVTDALPLSGACLYLNDLHDGRPIAVAETGEVIPQPDMDSTLDKPRVDANRLSIPIYAGEKIIGVL